MRIEILIADEESSNGCCRSMKRQFLANR